MSFFKKALASVGIGAAKVDTVIESRHESGVEAGEALQGTVQIQGGEVEQHIDQISITLVTNYYKERDDRKVEATAELARWSIAENITIKSGEQREIPFTLNIPYHAPITLGSTKVWLMTNLGITSAIDPKDHDFIRILPSPIVSTCLNALDTLGFRPKKAECLYAPRISRGFPYVQEIEFYPGPQFRSLQELEVIFFNSPSAVEVYMEVDRKARGLAGLFAEAFDLDETKLRFTLTQEEASKGPKVLAEQIGAMIQRYS